ncbi:hypothetical protein Q3304_09095 [Clostridioides sp. GD02377]|uniref:hypothetical protein n=1 Tax=unclassified Clostridioides TaxID=2635829 RepID=UPI00389D383C
MINNLNLKHQGSKYFINDRNEIGVQVEYIADYKSFNAELFVQVLQITCEILIENNFSEFMKII